ncbi:DUF1329 domain-containing protein [Craterilacuibacter sp. RT1T]|uniref:DUF1329 domain-containing protein n=1 Tax=Craterilacuibacter sp. RT1T TaxID=2942211 RepID=UPI0020BD6071|nr:DUF1329 domain-containing protein [Craterilacuibacter sp. RT1T]MCL6262701.1 DUF1329 domain-containing protein [Craterilacuibacter sp. RT1T]
MQQQALRIAATGAFVLFSAHAMAAISASEAARLGKDLTCVGAERAGNADGSIPAFSGKWLGAQANPGWKMNAGSHASDVYPNDKPLFVITAANMEKYADKLNEGQKALLKKYPDSYNMPVYQSRRDFRYPDYVCDTVLENAKTAKVTDNGMGVDATTGAIPFPIPKNGIEALWNMLLPHRPYTVQTVRDNATVTGNGIVWGRLKSVGLTPAYDPKVRSKTSDGVFSYYMTSTLLPEREKGGVTVSHEPYNFAKNYRLAWRYDPGTRRVRQVPGFGFDQPVAAVSGSMVIDEDRLFNGSPERYDWKLAGKREIYIPYNAYRVASPKLKYKDLLTQKHPNPEPMRYELHRVWVLEGKLKPGMRHLYPKRVIFLDEDSWHGVYSDQYDGQGKLWRAAIAHHYYSPDFSGQFNSTTFYHDLNSGSYVAYGMLNEQSKSDVLNAGGLNPEDFTADSARRVGK